MWTGEERSNKSIPAWLFYLVNQEDVDKLCGVLTKVQYETNYLEMHET